MICCLPVFYTHSAVMTYQAQYPTRYVAVRLTTPAARADCIGRERRAVGWCRPGLLFNG